MTIGRPKKPKAAGAKQIRAYKETCDALDTGRIAYIVKTGKNINCVEFHALVVAKGIEKINQ
jgi:hypothetical protein